MKEAIEHLREAVRLMPDQPDARNDLDRALRWQETASSRPSPLKRPDTQTGTSMPTR
jgi:hypothetical protein